MRKISLTILAILLVAGLTVFAGSGAQSHDAKSHSEWVAQSLREMETIKVGMTRADLLKVFREEGVFPLERSGSMYIGNVRK